MTTVLIYADHVRDAEGPALLQSLVRRLQALAAMQAIDHDALASMLIELGTFEAGVADVLCPLADGPHPALDALRPACEAAGLALAASWRAPDHVAEALQSAVAALIRVAPGAIPPSVPLRTAEGYAFYALYPEAYAEAAGDWLTTRPAGRVVCVGLRTIGTSLSAVVHGAMVLAGVQATSCTLRPRGHPFDRRAAIAPELARRWHPDRDVFLVIDEGPGLSGSSVAGTAAALSALGVPDDRIVLMTACHPDVARLRSEAARVRWSTHAVIAAPFERVRARVLASQGVAPEASDLSAGRWRRILACPRPWPPSHAQHERLKLLTDDGRMVRFAGLGQHGEAGRARAERLADHGWSVPPGRLGRGLLTLRLVQGVPLASYDADRTSIGRAAEYIGWLRRFESTDRAAPIAPLAQMLMVNAREGLGDAAAASADRLIAAASTFTEPAVAIDGRLLPHEWISTPGGLLKMDALDHHRDHFLPGLADAAWDVAGLIVEGRLAGAARASCLAAYVRASGDTSIARRLPFYLAAYAAFRLGYCAMAEPSVNADERTRFAAARARYAATLRSLLRVAGP